MNTSPSSSRAQSFDILLLSCRRKEPHPNLFNSYRAQAINSRLSQLAVTHHLDPRLILALRWAESGGSGNMMLPSSTAGSSALGPLQVTTGTALAMGANPNDPWSRANAGVAYFAELYNRYHGNVVRAIEAYHDGPNARSASPAARAEAAVFLKALQQQGAKVEIVVSAPPGFSTTTAGSQLASAR